MEPHVDELTLRFSPLFATLQRHWHALAAGVMAAWTMRRDEERFAHATDHRQLELLQREYDRRDVNVMPGWEWR
jgi:hypothetical protein